MKIRRDGMFIGGLHVNWRKYTCSKTTNWRNEQWIVNSHTDLVTCNVLNYYLGENYTLQAGRRNTRTDFGSVTYCIAIPIEVHTHWTHFIIWSQLATLTQGYCKIGDQQNKTKWHNTDRRVIYNETHGREPQHGRICPPSGFKCSDGVYPVWCNHSGWKEIVFSNVVGSHHVLQRNLHTHSEMSHIFTLSALQYSSNYCVDKYSH